MYNIPESLEDENSLVVQDFQIQNLQFRQKNKILLLGRKGVGKETMYKLLSSGQKPKVNHLINLTTFDNEDNEKRKLFGKCDVHMFDVDESSDFLSTTGANRSKLLFEGTRALVFCISFERKKSSEMLADFKLFEKIITCLKEHEDRAKLFVFINKFDLFRDDPFFRSIVEDFIINSKRVVENNNSPETSVTYSETPDEDTEAVLEQNLSAIDNCYYFTSRDQQTIWPAWGVVLRSLVDSDILVKANALLVKATKQCRARFGYLFGTAAFVELGRVFFKFKNVRDYELGNAYNTVSSRVATEITRKMVTGTHFLRKYDKTDDSIEFQFYSFGNEQFFTCQLTNELYIGLVFDSFHQKEDLYDGEFLSEIMKTYYSDKFKALFENTIVGS